MFYAWIIINLYLMQLSKNENFKELVEVNGFEPMTSCVQGRRSPN